MRPILAFVFCFFWTCFPSPVQAQVKTIHTGSYSIDYNTLTQAQITAHVNAIVSAVPKTTHIAIGTHLDYPDQIRLWSSAIHKKKKKLFLRSAGFNSWQGHNGVPATGTVDQHRADIVVWVQNNSDVFKSGDAFEVVPDEPENGAYWYTTFGPSGVGTNDLSKSQFNGFVQLTISDVNTKLAQLGVTGVSTGYLFTNPSVAKDIVTATTASMVVVGTDNYPENGSNTAVEMAAAMQSELDTWVVPAHPTRPKHITFGPSVWAQLTQQVQADAYSLEFDVITNTIANLDGVTIWQSGATWNPNSRIFDYTLGVWVSRIATQTINTEFNSL